MNIALLEAYIGNPGKYNEGQLAYTRLQFPTDVETVRAALKKIGIDSVEALGRMYIQELDTTQVPEHLIDYIDYEAYVRDVQINEDDHFAPAVMW